MEKAAGAHLRSALTGRGMAAVPLEEGRPVFNEGTNGGCGIVFRFYEKTAKQCEIIAVCGYCVSRATGELQAVQKPQYKALVFFADLDWRQTCLEALGLTLRGLLRVHVGLFALVLSWFLILSHALPASKQRQRLENPCEP